MTSRELIKLSALVITSLMIHVLILAGVPYRFSSDIKFKKERAEMKIRPFRPYVPPRMKIRDDEPRKGIPAKGKGSEILTSSDETEVSKSPVPGIDEQMGNMTARDIAGDVRDEGVLSDFLAMIRSDDMQQKLRQIENEKKRLWRGEGVVGKDLGKGGQGGKGSGKYKDVYLDPRVKLVVVSYPPTAIEQNHPPIIYPDMKVKKQELQTGWCNVVIRIYTDDKGKITRQRLLRPLGGGKRETLFRDHTLESIKSWRFDGKRAEIIIDVRYFVE